LKGIFTNKLSCFIFVLLGIAYMVSEITRLAFHTWDKLLTAIIRVITGHSIWQEVSFPSFYCATTSQLAEELCKTLTNNMSSFTLQVSWAQFSPCSRCKCHSLDANGRWSSPPSARVSPWPCILRYTPLPDTLD
jgi:hypothetical protein